VETEPVMLVSVKMDTLKTLPATVQSVTILVIFVLITILVPIVLLTDLMKVLHLVHVHGVIMITVPITKPVKLVLINVKPVPDVKELVTLVLNTELMLQLVNVNMDTMLTDNYVTNVLINVKLVLLSMFALFVLKTEKVSHIVTVNQVTMTMIPKTQSVILVMSNV
jgi:hypothetical protein